MRDQPNEVNVVYREFRIRCDNPQTAADIKEILVKKSKGQSEFEVRATIFGETMVEGVVYCYDVIRADRAIKGFLYQMKRKFQVETEFRGTISIYLRERFRVPEDPCLRNVTI